MSCSTGPCALAGAGALAGGSAEAAGSSHAPSRLPSLHPMAPPVPSHGASGWAAAGVSLLGEAASNLSARLTGGEADSSAAATVGAPPAPSVGHGPSSAIGAAVAGEREGAADVQLAALRALMVLAAPRRLMEVVGALLATLPLLALLARLAPAAPGPPLLPDQLLLPVEHSERPAALLAALAPLRGEGVAPAAAAPEGRPHVFLAGAEGAGGVAAGADAAPLVRGVEIGPRAGILPMVVDRGAPGRSCMADGVLCCALPVVDARSPPLWCLPITCGASRCTP